MLRLFDGWRLADVDTAFEIAAVLDDDAGGLNVAYELGILPDVDFFAGFYTALHFAHDHDLAGLHAGCLQSGVGSDGQPVSDDLHEPCDIAVDGQVLLAADVPLHHNARSEDCDRSGGLGRARGCWRMGWCGVPGILFGTFIPH